MANEAMNQEQALGVLVQAAKVGQSKGAYSLEDAEVIAKAIRVFTPPEPKPEAPAGEKKADKKLKKDKVVKE